MPTQLINGETHNIYFKLNNEFYYLVKNLLNVKLC
ncbi:hypothetical protein BCD91_003515 [Clostridium beijerinckii]|nr:hypothetical protein [Clostridium beijerinckii]